jgi:chromosomal replication initiation ATPase DnaA
MENRYVLASSEFDIEKVACRVAEVLEIEVDKVWEKGKHPEIVRARSLLCFRAVREIGITMTELAVMLGLTQPAVSISVKRGEKLGKEFGYRLTNQ